MWGFLWDLDVVDHPLSRLYLYHTIQKHTMIWYFTSHNIRYVASSILPTWFQHCSKWFIQGNFHVSYTVFVLLKRLLDSNSKKHNLRQSAKHLLESPWVQQCGPHAWLLWPPVILVCQRLKILRHWEMWFCPKKDWNYTSLPAVRPFSIFTGTLRPSRISTGWFDGDASQHVAESEQPSWLPMGRAYAKTILHKYIFWNTDES